MVTNKMKALCEKRLVDEWSLTDEEKELFKNNFLFVTTVFCNGMVTEVINRNTGARVGKSFDDKKIKWY